MYQYGIPTWTLARYHHLASITSLPCVTLLTMAHGSDDPQAGRVVVATQTMDIKVAGNGRMVLPASVRKAMGLHGDAKVILTIEDDQVRLSPIGHSVSRAQALYREHARQGRTTDDFLSDRRAEALADLGETASGDKDRDAR